MNKTGITIFASWMLLAAFLAATGDAGRDEAVAAIKKAYAETAASIALAQRGEGGGLYCNELVVNSRSGSWRASGSYLKKAAFWYSDQPAFAAAEGRKAESALAKVEVEERAAAVTVYREFFFVDGCLLFFFRSEKGGGTAVEERVYLKNGKPLLRLLGAVKAPGTADAAAILREAEHWQKLFLMSFDE